MVLDFQQLIRAHLTNAFIKISDKNPRYSLRAFAKKLNVSNSALSEIMRAKRKISKGKAIEFAKLLNLSQKEIDNLTIAFSSVNRIEILKNTENPINEVLIEDGHFHIMADWRYFSVLGLVRGSRGNMSTVEMARLLGLKSKEVSLLVEEMISVDIIQKRGNQLYVENFILRTSENFPKNLLDKRRIQSLEGAKFAIEENLSSELGFFSTIGVNLEKIEAAGELIEDFMKRLCIFLRDKDSTDIFEVSFNLFPRTIKK